MNDHARFRATYAALEVMRMLEGGTHNVLDVGGGHGVHTNFFRECGYTVDLVDILEGEPDRVFVGDFLNFIPCRKYDLVWSSHVLEHIQNFAYFLKNMIYCCKDEGLLAITVPPLKQQTTFGHVTLWNAGQLLVNLIKSGLDCREAKVYSRGYNVTVIVHNRMRSSSALHNFLPDEVALTDGYFNGEIAKINWETENISESLRLSEYNGMKVDEFMAVCSEVGRSGFVLLDDRGEVRYYWYDNIGSRVVIVS